MGTGGQRGAGAVERAGTKWRGAGGLWGWARTGLVCRALYCAAAASSASWGKGGRHCHCRIPNPWTPLILSARDLDLVRGPRHPPGRRARLGAVCGACPQPQFVRPVSGCGWFLLCAQTFGLALAPQKGWFPPTAAPLRCGGVFQPDRAKGGGGVRGGHTVAAGGGSGLTVALSGYWAHSGSEGALGAQWQ